MKTGKYPAYKITPLRRKNPDKMQFIYNISVLVKLTRAEADAIWAHAIAHPDTKQYTMQGGFLYPFVNLFRGQDVENTFKFREIDLMLKALEWPLDYDWRVTMPLINKLRSWCNAINAESQKLNK